MSNHPKTKELDSFYIAWEKSDIRDLCRDPILAEIEERLTNKLLVINMLPGKRYVIHCTISEMEDDNATS